MFKFAPKAQSRLFMESRCLQKQYVTQICSQKWAKVVEPDRSQKLFKTPRLGSNNGVFRRKKYMYILGFE